MSNNWYFFFKSVIHAIVICERRLESQTLVAREYCDVSICQNRTNNFSGPSRSTDARLQNVRNEPSSNNVTRTRSRIRGNEIYTLIFISVFIFPRVRYFISASLKRHHPVRSPARTISVSRFVRNIDN